MATPLTSRSEWLAANPPVAGRLTATLAGVADRAQGGEDFRHAVREFLDEFVLHGSDGSRAESIAECPALTDDPRHDAYLGALAEYLAKVHDLDRPQWSLQPDRFLDRFFVSEVPGAVKGFLESEDPAAAPVLDLPGLRVLAASPETLLALKVLAHRVGEDEEDVRLLAPTGPTARLAGSPQRRIRL